MRLPILFLFSLILWSFSSCGSDAHQSTGDTNSPAPETTAEPPNEEADGSIPLYAWVDRLNMRSFPNTSAEVVAKLETTTPLTPTGRQSEQAEAIVLRGILYEAPWIEVETAEGKSGWVFGGAVKAEGELKGNPPITEEEFNFPAFGNFDLSEWEKISEADGDEEGDFDRLTTRYRKDDQQLSIESYAGEYGYGYSYRLEEAGGLLSERHFRFDNMELKMTEEVVDHRGLQPKSFSRTQTSPLPYQQLNARPMILDGDWEEG